ncbi:Gfo/Idh/MocA family protein [Paludifilum halophilum]|uniref:Oxidoreductase n=1 Tax=Paludifilum halophilum TaxID=1642702 RepID=A0A235B851_9BACL|nr:Gfo/Idh/MocA family oxidoreductase [Paludifilum halophilum]OYD08037.1 oxidoreductase [Paludifilum halophilum]
MIRYGIVGCGHIAKKHVNAIRAVEGAELAAVCDKDPDRLSFWNEEVAGFTDMEAMLSAVQLDVVNICTPSGLHPSLTIQAAEAGKHVVVEKPMALTLKDADAMIRACERNGVRMAVVHPNRFRPAMRELRKRVEAEAFGTFSHANATVRWNRDQEYYDQAPWRGTRAMDGGVLMNQAIHNLDLLLWMMGEVEEVFSYQATRLRNIESEDTSVSVLRFKNGALGAIEAAVTLYPRNLEESLALFGETGTAVIGGPTANWIQTWKFADETDSRAAETIHRINEDPYGKPGHQCLIEDMTEAVRTGRQPAVTGSDGRRALALIVACQESARTGRPVQMDTWQGKTVAEEGSGK